MGYIMTNDEHESRCRMADLKLNMVKAFHERQPGKLTVIEAAMVFNEIAADFMEMLHGVEYNAPAGRIDDQGEEL